MILRFHNEIMFVVYDKGHMAYILFGFFLTYFQGLQGFVVPDELPTALSIIYSNIPSVRLGTDSRLGWGFRFGDRADAQVLLELGPQTYTQPLANDQSINDEDRTLTDSSSFSVNHEEYNTDNILEEETMSQREAKKSSDIILQDKYQQEEELTSTEDKFEALTNLVNQVMSKISGENEYASDKTNILETETMIDIISEINEIKQNGKYSEKNISSDSNISAKTKRPNYKLNENEIDQRISTIHNNTTMANMKEDSAERKAQHKKKEANIEMNEKTNQTNDNCNHPTEEFSETKISNNTITSEENRMLAVMIQLISKMKSNIESEYTVINNITATSSTEKAKNTSDNIQSNVVDTKEFHKHMTIAIKGKRNEKNSKIEDSIKNRTNSLNDIVNDFMTKTLITIKSGSNDTKVHATIKPDSKIGEIMKLKENCNKTNIRTFDLPDNILDDQSSVQHFDTTKYKTHAINIGLINDSMKVFSKNEKVSPKKVYIVEEKNSSNALQRNTKKVKQMENEIRAPYQKNISNNSNLTNPDVETMNNLVLQLVSKIMYKKENKKSENDRINNADKLTCLLKIMNHEQKSNQVHSEQNVSTNIDRGAPILMNTKLNSSGNENEDLNKTSESKMSTTRREGMGLNTEKIQSNSMYHDEVGYIMDDEIKPLKKLMDQLIMKLIEKKDFQGDEEEKERRDIVKMLVSLYEVIEEKKKQTLTTHKYHEDTRYFPISQIQKSEANNKLKGFMPTLEIFDRENELVTHSSNHSKEAPIDNISHVLLEVGKKDNSNEIFKKNNGWINELKRALVGDHDDEKELLNDGDAFTILKQLSKNQISNRIRNYKKNDKGIFRVLKSPMIDEIDTLKKHDKINTLKIQPITVESSEIDIGMNSTPNSKIVIGKDRDGILYSSQETNNMLRQLNILLAFEALSRDKNPNEEIAKIQRRHVMNELVFKLKQMIWERVNNSQKEKGSRSAIVSSPDDTNKITKEVNMLKQVRKHIEVGPFHNEHNRYLETGKFRNISRPWDQKPIAHKISEKLFINNVNDITHSEEKPSENQNWRLSKKIKDKAVEELYRTYTLPAQEGERDRTAMEWKADVNIDKAEKYLQNSISSLQIASQKKKSRRNELNPIPTWSQRKYFGGNYADQLSPVLSGQKNTDKYDILQAPKEVTKNWLHKWSRQVTLNSKPAEKPVNKLKGRSEMERQNVKEEGYQIDDVVLSLILQDIHKRSKNIQGR